MTKIQPQDMAAYLDSVRPMMDEVKLGMRVDVCGLGKYLKATAFCYDTCTARVEIRNSSKWIRVEQIEYVYPY